MAEAECRAKDADDSLVVTRVASEAAEHAARDANAAKEAIQVVLDESERVRASEVDSVVRQAIAQFRSSEDFTVLLDQKVCLEVADLIF